MARSLEAISAAQFSGITPADIEDILALVDRNGAAAAFDPSYGDRLRQLLPRHLSELTTRH